MRLLKLALLLGGFLGVLLGAGSMENNEDQFLSSLKEKFPVITNKKYISGYPLATHADISEIESKLNHPLPKSLKNFYMVAGNLRLENFEPAVPNGGVESELYQLILKCQAKMKGNASGEWIPFCAANGLVEFFCIHRGTGNIRRYVVPEGFEENEIYQDICDWISNKILQ